MSKVLKIKKPETEPVCPEPHHLRLLVRMLEISRDLERGLPSEALRDVAEGIHGMTTMILRELVKDISEVKVEIE